jgi:hypothetical protein
MASETWSALPTEKPMSPCLLPARTSEFMQGRRPPVFMLTVRFVCTTSEEKRGVRSGTARWLCGLP